MRPSNYDIQTDIDLDSIVVEEIGWRSRIAQRFEIATLLRLFGSGITVMGILLFLFQRWDDSTDLLRYGMILGETLTLTALGFITSLWLKEQKSARVFLGLSMVSTSAVFTILGAMIYSQVQWFPSQANLPDFAFWVADSLDTVIWLIAGSFVLLGGQSLFSFSVLARPVAARLSLHMMLNVCLLLLPIRDLGITTLLAAPALLFGFHHLSSLRRATPAMKTTEGTIAGVLVMLPLLIMIGRGAYLYAAGSMAFGSIALLSYLVLRQLALSITTLFSLRRSLEIASLLPALLTAFFYTQVLEGMAPQIEHWQVAVFGTLLSGFLLDLGRRAESGGDRYHLAIFYTGLVISVIEEAVWPGVSTALFATLVSGMVLLFAYAKEENGLLRLALLTQIGSFVLLLSRLLVSFDMGAWFSLGLLGMSIIILAAAIERFSKQVTSVFHRLKF
jgi:hypothetical protein